jgi:hypothetical protein
MRIPCAPFRLGWGALLCALSFAGSAAAADGSTPSLRISGTATLTTETRRLQDAFEIRITLGDEVGRPLAGAEIRTKATTEPGAATATLQRCGGARMDSGAQLSLTTDASGNACVVVTNLTTGTLDVTFDDPRGYFSPARSTVALPESANEAIDVGFDPPLSSLSLDQPLQSIGLVARSRANAAAPEAAELVLSLVADGSERELTRVALDGFGEVHRLSLVSQSFGTPGPARLVARLRGQGRERAQASIGVLRTATVALELASDSPRGVSAGATLEVRAASTLGPAPSGVVEVRSQGRSIAAAPVVKGRAHLTLPSSLGTGSGSVVTLEYVGDGPGWLPGPLLELRALPPSPSYARYALWICAALLAGVAVALGWRRPLRERPSKEEAPLVHPRPSLEVLEALGAGAGYRGVVRDAHEGTPIAPAVLSFVTAEPTTRVLLEIATQPDGSFQVEQAFPPGTRLEVAAPFHASLTAALPGPGVLQLSLVSRRRALLDRLVRWAERGGRPWTEPTRDATPAHVAAVAGAENEPEVERWAQSVERLAFGPAAPDAAAELAANVTREPALHKSESSAPGAQRPRDAESPNVTRRG